MAGASQQAEDTVPKVYGRICDLFTVLPGHGVNDTEGLAVVLSQIASSYLETYVTDTIAQADAHEKDFGGVVWPLDYVTNRSVPGEPLIQRAQGQNPLVLRAASLLHTVHPELRCLQTVMFDNTVIVLTSRDAHEYRKNLRARVMPKIVALDTGEIISAEGRFGRGMKVDTNRGNANCFGVYVSPMLAANYEDI
jgi:hypothetical protein